MQASEAELEQDGMIEELEARITKARQALLAGPACLDEQSQDVKMLISDQLPRAVEEIQRRPVSMTVAKRTAAFFAAVQDFVDTCLRSNLLGEGLLRLDLGPVLYVLRCLLSAESVPPRYAVQGAQAGVPPLHYFNRDHGRPLLRAFRGCSKMVWPDDEESARYRKCEPRTVVAVLQIVVSKYIH